MLPNPKGVLSEMKPLKAGRDDSYASAVVKTTGFPYSIHFIRSAASSARRVGRHVFAMKTGFQPVQKVEEKRRKSEASNAYVMETFA